MSDIKYGLISQKDANLIESTLSLISTYFREECIYTCEVGVFDGQTSRGINEWFTNYKIKNYHTAIDNNKDKEILKPFPECNLIIGDADEVAFKIADNSQHFIFIDACHCFAHVISNFFSYAPKVKPGGYMAFHDTGAHIKPFKDFQHGDPQNPDAYISCRKALDAMKMFDEWGSANSDLSIIKNHKGNRFLGWELIFDEADNSDLAGGVTVFQKIK